MILPEIEAIGIYNTQKLSNDKKLSKNRKATMFEIELPMEKGGVSYINNEAYPILPNTIICAKPGQIRHTKFPYKCYYIHMVLKEGFIYDILTEVPDRFTVSDREKYQKIFTELYDFYSTGQKSDEIMMQSLLLKLIYTIKKETDMLKNLGGTKSGNSTAIEDALKYIKANLTEDLSLKALSQRSSLSPIYFHNSFKAAVGMTLHEYVEEQRIKKAADLLMTTDHTLTEIAYRCGFSSQSYFSYAFKRKMGSTPRQYTRKLNKEYAKIIQ